MAVTRTTTNVLVGYADIYLAPANEPIPTSAATLAVPAGNWSGVGFTEAGLDFSVARSITEITVEEQLTPVTAVVSGADVIAKWAFAEDIIENRKYAYGGTLVTTPFGASQIGKKTLTLSETLTQYALLFEGTNKYGYPTRAYIPVVAQFGSADTSYQAQSKRLIPVEFRALCPMSQIIVIEQTDVAH